MPLRNILRDRRPTKRLREINVQTDVNPKLFSSCRRTWRIRHKDHRAHRRDPAVAKTGGDIVGRHLTTSPVVGIHYQHTRKDRAIKMGLTQAVEARQGPQTCHLFPAMKLTNLWGDRAFHSTKPCPGVPKPECY